MKASDLKADPANPNRMSDDDKGRMAKSLAEFGDLGGIILNRRTGLLIGGHQRTSVLKEGTMDIRDLDTPEPDGTVARGTLNNNGRKYAVRVVDWDEAKAHAALLAANRFGRVGSDDPAILKDLLQKLDTCAIDMELTGFTTAELEALMKNDNPLKSIDIKKPPRIAWILIGVPIGKFGKIAAMAEVAAKIEGSIVETTANDGIKEN